MRAGNGKTSGYSVAVPQRGLGRGAHGKGDIRAASIGCAGPGFRAQWPVPGGAGENRAQMTNMPEPDEAPGNPPEPIKPPKPKRGAFPTPKSEIEKAKPYIPDVGQEEYRPEGNPDRPTDIEDEEEG